MSINKRKTLQELTLKDNFMFGAVMMEEENCRRLLELVLGFPIERVEVSKEKSIVYHPEYKGVRLDIFAKDEHNTHYNVEMQVARKEALGRRSRYYHSQLDMELLSKSISYSALPDAYVIFICDFDPFGQRKYCYTFESRCLELPNFQLPDGSWTIFLSTKGMNTDEVPEPLVNFLKFVAADLENSIHDFGDTYVKQLQDSMRQIKESREMEGRYMNFEELLQDEHTDGKVEGKIEDLLFLLGERGTIPVDLKATITEETNLQTLDLWFRIAVKSHSIEDFIKGM